MIDHNPVAIGNRTLMALMNNLPVGFEQNVMNNTFPLAYLYAKESKSCQCIETFLKDFPISNSAQTEKRRRRPGTHKNEMGANKYHDGGCYKMDACECKCGYGCESEHLLYSAAPPLHLCWPIFFWQTIPI